MNTVSPQGNAQSQPEAWSSRAANTWLDDCFETPINLNYFWEVMKWENTYMGFYSGGGDAFLPLAAFLPGEHLHPSSTTHHPPIFG